MAGDNYYPQSGTDDWIGLFDSREEARSKVKEITDAKNKVYAYRIGDIKYDWYEIVDLYTWGS